MRNYIYIFLLFIIDTVLHVYIFVEDICEHNRRHRPGKIHGHIQTKSH